MKRSAWITAALNDLPLVEVPATPATRHEGSDVLAVLITGDGGWADIDQDVSRALAGRGVSVVGLSTLKYFWTPRTPEGSAKDLERILRYYMPRWKKDRVLLIGYSLGADILPFMASRLPEELITKTTLIVLLGLDGNTNFEFHLSDWLGGSGKKGLPTLPEVAKLSGIPLLCLYGKEDSECVCSKIHQTAATSVALPGAHHFGGNYPALAALIMNALEGRK